MLQKIASSLKRARLQMEFGKKTLEAADQLWSAVVMSGESKGVEIPVVYNSNDPTMRAVFVLQQLQPDCRLIVRQSRTFVLTCVKRGIVNLSDEAFSMMEKGGQFGQMADFSGGLEHMLRQQESFVRGQGFDPKTMQKEAQETEASKKGVIEVKGPAADSKGPAVDGIAEAVQKLSDGEA